MEEITLEKIDIIRQRSNLTYAEAKEVLEKNNGNLIDTLIYIEQNNKNILKNISNAGSDLVDTIKDIIKKGNVNRIKIKKDNKVLVDIPVNAGIAAGAISLGAPYVLAIAAISALVTKVTIEIEKSNGDVEIINNVVKERAEDIKEKTEEVINDIKNNISNITNKNNYNDEHETKSSEEVNNQNSQELD
ncbi:UBA/TS-N domain-containing protein [Fervidicella metallireducens AeB]|uniref:UBA/TS-N domain-containing protein n=1 Tax=Fervidicella metallireducens AeB TaxID=1403537 RepID=A0A017RU62_9CLOT|nr:DUF4342 domain-containing protein [Fervidicella metallireducens]EYE88126.1 UBA/TS-N domain-containing protein [Fervidicella metallireducens AeB]